MSSSHKIVIWFLVLFSMLVALIAFARIDRMSKEVDRHQAELKRVDNACRQQASVLRVQAIRLTRGEDVTEQTRDILAYAGPMIWLCTGDWAFVDVTPETLNALVAKIEEGREL